jgi:hypothetical protein
METFTFLRLGRVVCGLALGLLPLSGFGQSATWQWVAAQTNTPTSTSSIRAVVVDAAGATVVAGSFTGSIMLGSTTLSSAGGSDGFVARLSPGGTWTQALRLGGSADDAVRGLALDAGGSACLVGEFNSPTVSVGAATLNNADASGSTADIFVARLDAGGSWTQATRAGGSANDYANAVGLAGDGTATVAGFFISSTASFGATTLSNADASGSSADVFVARLSSAGSWTQAVRAGGLSGDGAAALAVDAAGNAVVAGAFSSNTATFGTYALTNADPNGRSDDVFVARLSAGGSWTQAARAGTFGLDFSTGLAVDATGAATVVGAFFGPTTAFGPTTLTNADASGGSTDGFVARLSPGGSWTQAARFGGSGDDEASAVALDASGSAAVAGTFRSPSISFGAATLANTGATSQTGDVFVARLGSTGSWAQAVQAGGFGPDNAYALALDGSGSTTVGGLFTGASATFGSIVVNTRTTSVFVARLAGLVSSTAAAAGPPDFSLAPNPAHGVVRLTLAAPAPGTPLLLFDALGREVRRLVLPPHATTASLEVAGLAPGSYVVRLGAATQQLTVE